MQERYILYMAKVEGSPMYCLMSARSIKAQSIAPVTLEVANIKALRYL